MAEIGLASDEDFLAVSNWLKSERNETGEGFFCNINIIRSGFSEKTMYVLREGNEPLAFLVNGLTTDGIMETHPAHRQKGYGKKLFEFALQREIEKGTCVLHIDCAPDTSVQFWMRNGFTVSSQSYTGMYAYRVLEKELSTPPDGTPIDVEIKFYFEADRFAKGGMPYAVYSPRAVEDANGDVYLANRIIYNRHSDPKGGRGDGFAEVSVNGKTLFFNKMKYEEAEELGFDSDDSGNFYIDVISVP